MSSSNPLVTLANGPAVPLAAVRLVWNLEARGCHLGITGDVLRIGPRERLTDEDRAAIHNLKPAIIDVIRYVTAIG